MKSLRRNWRLVAFLALIATFSMGCQSEPETTSEFGELKSDVDRMKTELEEVKREVQLIRQFLSRATGQPTQPQRVVADVSIAGNPMMGKKDAPVTLIEFSDYQCPFCKRFFQNTLPTLKTEYIETGKVRYVFRDFPLDRIHPHARKAAEAAHCAGDQDKYWQMHDLLFQNQEALQVEQLKVYARRLELNPSTFETCLEKSTYAAKVQKDLDAGMEAGIRGTPGFFIGKTGPDDTIQGTLISGAHPPNVFRHAIDSLLQQQ